MKNVVSIDELRTNLAELIGRVMYGREHIVIRKYNKDAAILLSVEEYEKLIDPYKRFSKEQWKNKFALMDKIRESIPEVDQEILEEAIDKAVKAVRAENRAKLNK